MGADHDRGWPQQFVIDDVAFGSHRNHDTVQRGVGDRRHRHRFVHLRVERAVERRQQLHAEPLQLAEELLAHQFDPAFDASTIELRESKGGKYLGVTVTVTATSREQLDELYRTLSTHPMVKVVL